MSFIDGSRGIRIIRKAIEEYKPRPLYIMFSGGKDSALATYYTLKVTGNVIMIFIHIPGQTHLDNIRAVYGFVKELEEKIGEKIRVKRITCRRKKDLLVTVYREMENTPILIHAICNSYTLGLPYWQAVERYGFPAPSERFNNGQGKRWCCAEFKSLWFNTLPPNNPRRQRVLVSGVKRFDSVYRRKRYREYILSFKSTHTRYEDVVVFPLIDYTDVEVILELRKQGFNSILEQYKKWRRSPNCVLCPLMGREALMKAVDNLPCNYIRSLLPFLEKLRQRYRENTFTYKKLTEWINTMRRKQCP